MRGKIPNHTFSIQDQTFEFYNGFYFRLFDTKERGYAFGEIAIMSADSLRKATIKCEQDCVFAEMSRRNYEKQI